MLTLFEINRRIKNKNRLYWMAREAYVVIYSSIARMTDRPKRSSKKRVLFYHVNSLGFGGTEKYLQILAKHLDKEKYEAYYMHPAIKGGDAQSVERLAYLSAGNIISIPFEHDRVRPTPPYFVEGMNPDIKKLVRAMNVDLVVVPDSGHANYPFSIIGRTPIILLNIFGQPNVQSNIRYHLSISKEVASKLGPIVPDDKIRVLPVPSEGPLVGSPEAGRLLRAKLGIPDGAMLFGRIGRADDSIYDPIGIEAFKIALKSRQDIHYLVMSAPPVLRKKVSDEGIPNVHFLLPSSKDEDVWAFHAAIDCLAHFRMDGESFGLNIVESMLSGKPIITHRSHIWNAHLEYLEDSFSRVSEKGDAESYAKHMLEFASLHQAGTLGALGEKARDKAKALFHIDSCIKEFERLADEAIEGRP